MHSPRLAHIVGINDVLADPLRRCSPAWRRAVRVVVGAPLRGELNEDE